MSCNEIIVSDSSCNPFVNTDPSIKSIDTQAIIGLVLMFLLVIYASIRTASSSQVGKLALASRTSTGGASEATTLREGGGASDVNLMEEGSRQQVRPEKLPCEFGMGGVAGGAGGGWGVKSLAYARPFPVTFSKPCSRHGRNLLLYPIPDKLFPSNSNFIPLTNFPILLILCHSM